MSSRKFPVLSTKRLTLRAAASKDVAEFHALLSIPEVTRYSNWPDAPNKTQIERSLRWIAKVHASGKGCAWIIKVAGSKGDRRRHSLQQFRQEMAQRPDWLRTASGLLGQRPDDGSGPRRGCLRTPDLQVEPHRRLDLAGQCRIGPRSGKVGARRQAAPESLVQGAFHDFRIFGRVAGDAMSST